MTATLWHDFNALYKNPPLDRLNHQVEISTTTRVYNAGGRALNYAIPCEK